MNKQIKQALVPLSLAIVALVAFKLTLDEWYSATEIEELAPQLEKARLDCARLPLHCAVRDGDAAALRQRLAAGADMESRDGNGNSALMLAVRHGRYPLAGLLLAAGADANSRDDQGRTVLFHVLDAGQLALAKRLLAAGAEVDALSGNAYPATVLHYCVMKNRTDCVRLLLDHGARTDIPDSFGLTVMQRLDRHPHIDTAIRRLLEASAS